MEHPGTEMPLLSNYFRHSPLAPCGRGVLRMPEREIHLECGSATELAVVAYRAVVRLDNPVRDRQTESRPSALVLACAIDPIEPLEDVTQIGAGDADSGVLHDQPSPVFVAQDGNVDLSSGVGVLDGVVK